MRPETIFDQLLPHLPLPLLRTLELILRIVMMLEVRTIKIPVLYRNDRIFHAFMKKYISTISCLHKVVQLTPTSWVSRIYP